MIFFCKTLEVQLADIRVSIKDVRNFLESDYIKNYNPIDEYLFLNKIISAVIDNKLKDIDITYSDEQAICVMLTSGGYPESYEKGKVITGLDDLDDDIVVFHSGTKLVDGKIVTNGGRVIGITAKAKNVKEAGEKVYENIKKINFEGMHYRTDIWK